MYPCAMFPAMPRQTSRTAGLSGGFPASCLRPCRNPSGPGVFRRILAAGLAVLAFASAAPCLAQTNLVSNMSETNTADGARVYSSGGQATFIAQEFTTGSNADGYLLSEVVVNVIVDDPVHYNPGTPVFTLHESTPHTNGDPIPGAKIADLTGSVATAGEQAFTVSGDPIPLAANTLYFLYFQSDSGDIQLQSTTSDDETSDAGWKLGKSINWVDFGLIEGWQTMPEFNVAKVTIKGSVGGGIKTQTKTPPPPPPQAPDAPEVTLAGTGTVGLGRTAVTASHQSRTDSTTTGLDVRWAEPDNTHCPRTCPAITHYELQYRRGTSGAWTDWPELIEGTETTIDIPDLMAAYEVRVRAVNEAGQAGRMVRAGILGSFPRRPGGYPDRGRHHEPGCPLEGAGRHELPRLPGGHTLRTAVSSRHGRPLDRPARNGRGNRRDHRHTRPGEQLPGARARDARGRPGGRVVRTWILGPLPRSPGGHPDRRQHHEPERPLEDTGRYELPGLSGGHALRSPVPKAHGRQLGNLGGRPPGRDGHRSDRNRART